MANSILSRRQNISMILRAIQRQPGISQPEICRECALTASTVHEIVRLLDRRGLVVNTGTGKATGGRRAFRFELNQSGAHAFAVNMRIDRVEVALIDLGLNAIEKRVLKKPLNEVGPEEYAREIAKLITDIRISCSVGPEDLIGIGVSVPGPTDFETGTIRNISGAPRWDGYPIARALWDACMIRTWADKDVYAAIRMLTREQRSPSHSPLVYISVREGIGMAAMVGGRILRGANSLAGEIGHVCVERDGVLCRCGRRGCLEQYCSDIGILARYNERADEPCADVNALLLRFERGDADAKEVIETAVRYFAELTSTIIMNYDPGDILIHCRWLNRLKDMYFDMLNKVNRGSALTQRYECSIHFDERDDTYLRAAGMMVFDEQLLRADGLLIASLSDVDRPADPGLRARPPVRQ